MPLFTHKYILNEIKSKEILKIENYVCKEYGLNLNITQFYKFT